MQKSVTQIIYLGPLPSGLQLCVGFMQHIQIWWISGSAATPAKSASRDSSLRYRIHSTRRANRIRARGRVFRISQCFGPSRLLDWRRLLSYPNTMAVRASGVEAPEYFMLSPVAVFAGYDGDASNAG